MKGSKIDLCVVQKNLHLRKYLEWLNDPTINKYLLRGIHPLTRGQEENWFDQLDKAKDRIIFAIADKKGQTIGNVGLHRIDHLSRTAEAGTFIGDSSEWGKGYGSEAKRMIISYGFASLNLQKIFVSVFADNKASLRANQKAGLKEEARLKKHIWKNNKYNDLVILSVFKN